MSCFSLAAIKIFRSTFVFRNLIMKCPSMNIFGFTLLRIMAKFKRLSYYFSEYFCKLLQLSSILCDSSDTKIWSFCLFPCFWGSVPLFSPSFPPSLTPPSLSPLFFIYFLLPFFSVSLCCSDWVISIALSSNSVIPPSVFSFLLLIPSVELFSFSYYHLLFYNFHLVLLYIFYYFTKSFYFLLRPL